MLELTTATSIPDSITNTECGSPAFLVMGLLHLLRIIFGWQAEIGGLSIPFWASWLALPVMAALAYFGFMQNR
jgi:hypothetical protein